MTSNALVEGIDTRLYIGGERVDGIDGGRLDVFNPATEELLATVAAATEPDVDRAVVAAQRAFDGEWSEMTPSWRGSLIWNLAERLEAAAEQFTIVETLDNGKPITLARGDIAASVEVLRYYAGWAGKIDGRSVRPVATPGWRAMTLKRPLGVVGQIIPWNFPLNMASCGVWGSDIGALLNMVERLDAGTVWINGYHAVDPALPFGGYKSSGWRRELGPESLEHYTETTTVNMNLSW